MNDRCSSQTMRLYKRKAQPARTFQIYTRKYLCNISINGSERETRNYNKNFISKRTNLSLRAEKMQFYTNFYTYSIKCIIIGTQWFQL